ncbi:GIY-YIG nuclease family protein, partial [Photobacterium minamisatsumaniensis]|uniref:GIY-YIG nuclease family protein n=1 Tax=Photobacterium minamisatsumaniensis TaxID=2910233 RepID=UPI003D10A4D7
VSTQEEICRIMKKVCVRPDGKYVCDFLEGDAVRYTSEPYETADEAIEETSKWYLWAKTLPNGKADSIYYIIEVPETWSGPHDLKNLFSGLRVKIGRSNNPLKRLSNLQTGCSGELIICALEPGHSKKESELHKLFSKERRQGEWFVCTPKLFEHLKEVLTKNTMLPPEHRCKLENVIERAYIYSSVRDVFGGAPDIVNPSLDEDWSGSVFVDLVNGPHKLG